MSSYRGSADSHERAAAIAAVVAVHAALAFVILTGLNVRVVSRAVEQLTLINLRKPPAPPLPRPAPIRHIQAASKPVEAKRSEGAPAPRRSAAGPVAPRPVVPIPAPVPTARAAGSGSAPNSGASSNGNGTGAGGAGTGTGGGGYGDYSHFTPARLISNIPDSQYARLAATGIQSGAVGVVILVGSSGQVSNCRIARSSGQPSIDALVCKLTLDYVRFEPARDPAGRPIAQDITYFPSWRRR